MASPAMQPYRDLFQRMPVPAHFWRHKGDGVFELVDFNQAQLDLTAGGARGYLGVASSEFYRDRPHMLEGFERSWRTRDTVAIETEHRVESTGELLYLHLSFVFVPPDHVVVIGQDLTDRQRAEQALSEAESKYRTLVEQIPAMVYISNLDPSKPPHYVSPQWEKWTGYAPEHFARDPYLGMDLIHPEEKDLVDKSWHRLIETGEPFSAEYRLAGRDGSYHWVRDEAVLLRDENGEPVAIQGVTMDVTDLKVAEEKIRRREENFRTLFDGNPLPMWAYDVETLRFVAVNDAAISKYGYTEEEFLSMKLTDIRPEEEVGRLLSIEHSDRPGDTDAGEWKHRLKDGTIITVEITSHEIELEGRSCRLVVAYDVRKRKEAEREKEALEAQLRQSMKMEAVGQLAGGVAHDFNNLLAVVRNYVDFAAESIDADHPALEDLAEARKAADRGARLTRRLLTFSRRDVAQPQVIDVNETLREMEGMLRTTLTAAIEIHWDATQEPIHVVIDPSQFEQIVMNLAVNARDAMAGAGTFTISTASGPGPAGGDEHEFVRIGFRDTGAGMSEEVASRVFEPFFTTKPKGEGTGLGLATAYGIVTQGFGHIEIDSEPGKGTEVVVFLPLTDQRPVPTRAEERGVSTAAEGTILVADDEPAVLELTRRILSGAGYEVIAAPSGTQALELFERDGSTVDLLLTDVIMPRMSGRELRDRMVQRAPGVKTIFMSGYTDRAISEHWVLDEGENFIGKPFAAQELLEKVRLVLKDPV